MRIASSKDLTVSRYLANVLEIEHCVAPFSFFEVGMPGSPRRKILLLLGSIFPPDLSTPYWFLDRLSRADCHILLLSSGYDGAGPDIQHMTQFS